MADLRFLELMLIAVIVLLKSNTHKMKSLRTNCCFFPQGNKCCQCYICLNSTADHDNPNPPEIKNNPSQPQLHQFSY